MDVTLTVKNIVFVGEFNPQILDKYFFIKNAIVDENDIQSNSHFLNDISILNTPKFNLTTVPNQMVFSDLVGEFTIDSAIDTIRILIKASNLNPTAMGVNFHWYVISGDRTTELSKKYFFNENDMLTQRFFKGENVSYGTYLSKDFGLSRLKLDIKPTTVTKIDSNTTERTIGFLFNFHIDLDGSSVLLNNVLEEAPKYCTEAKTILDSYEFD